jgi:hypothetical protein
MALKFHHYVLAAAPEGGFAHMLMLFCRPSATAGRPAEVAAWNGVCNKPLLQIFGKWASLSQDMLQ